MRKYLAEDGVAVPPPAPSRAGTQPQVIAPLTGLVDAWLAGAVDPYADAVREVGLAAVASGTLHVADDERLAGRVKG